MRKLIWIYPITERRYTDKLPTWVTENIERYTTEVYSDEVLNGTPKTIKFQDGTGNEITLCQIPYYKWHYSHPHWMVLDSKGKCTDKEYTGKLPYNFEQSVDLHNPTYGEDGRIDTITFYSNKTCQPITVKAIPHGKFLKQKRHASRPVFTDKNTQRTQEGTVPSLIAPHVSYFKPPPNDPCSRTPSWKPEIPSKGFTKS